MTLPADFHLLSERIAIWQRYDRSVKADLFSTAIITPEGICLIDPTPLDPAALKELQSRGPIVGIVITNQNHWRASADLAARLQVEIFAHENARLPERAQTFTAVSDNQQIVGDLRVITIEGAAPGEIIIASEIDGGLLVIGDALINFEPYGFTFLPPKYCTDNRKMKKSLRRLLDVEAQRIFFAHGSPILSNATARLHGLLQSE